MGYETIPNEKSEKEVATSEIPLRQYGGHRDSKTLDSIREVMSEVMTSGICIA